MATGDHDWTAGEQVTAANVDDYLQLQTVQQYAAASNRDTALSARKREGMVTYQLDTNNLTVYSGAAWSTVGPVHGAGTTWTPTVTQLGSVTVTNTHSVYWRVGRLITALFEVAVTGAGTTANDIVISLPVTALSAANSPIIGSVHWYDASTNFTYIEWAMMVTTTTVKMTIVNGGVVQFQSAPALASGDGLTGSFTYEAAADA